MRWLTTLVIGLLAIAGLVPTGTPAPAAAATPPADGKVIVSCGWSDAGDCPFNAVKGSDYLLRVWAAQDCDGHIELVNPVGQVTMDIPVSDYTDGCDGSSGGAEFRAAYTGTFQLRYVPSGEIPPGPDAAAADILTDCRGDAKTQCVLALGAPPQASEHSTNGDPDWLRMPNLRRGKFYTVTATNVDVAFTQFAVVDAKGTALARAHTLRGSTTCTVRFRPKANGTYFLAIPNGYHRTLRLR
jgi:hypothetical protein